MPCPSSYCPIHAPQSIDFWSLFLFLKAWVHAFPWAFWYSPDETTEIHSFITQNSHPQSHTPSLHKIPLNIPIIPIVSKFHPKSSKFHPNSQFILYTFLWKPTNQSSGGIIIIIIIIKQTFQSRLLIKLSRRRVQWTSNHKIKKLVPGKWIY